MKVLSLFALVSMLFLSGCDIFDTKDTKRAEVTNYEDKITYNKQVSLDDTNLTAPIDIKDGLSYLQILNGDDSKYFMLAGTKVKLNIEAIKSADQNGTDRFTVKLYGINSDKSDFIMLLQVAIRENNNSDSNSSGGVDNNSSDNNDSGVDNNNTGDNDNSDNNDSTDSNNSNGGGSDNNNSGSDNNNSCGGCSDNNNTGSSDDNSTGGSDGSSDNNSTDNNDSGSGGTDNNSSGGNDDDNSGSDDNNSGGGDDNSTGDNDEGSDSNSTDNNDSSGGDDNSSDNNNTPLISDSDNDNIPDNIEALLGMDSNNSDENSNGIIDGLEGDPFFGKEWYIHANGTPMNPSKISSIVGNDLHLLDVYKKYMGYNNGNPIILQIVDSGVDIKHEDLKANIDINRSLNGDKQGDPVPGGYYLPHGTMLAGIAAARGLNNIGVRGVAPFAKIAGSNWLVQQSLDGLDAAQYSGNGANEIAVTNNSWGTYYTIDTFYEDIMEEGTKTLRDGKGRVYIFASGNARADNADANIQYGHL